MIAVQNAVDYRDLGVATSGVMLFRAIGALTGITVFNATFSHRLDGRVAKALSGVRLPKGFDPISIQRDPQALYQLPPSQRGQFIDTYADSFHTMFEVAIPIALAGLVLGIFLREVPLRPTTTAFDLGQCLGGTPTARSSRDEIERLLLKLLHTDSAARQKVHDVYRDLGAQIGIDCPPGSLRALCQIVRLGPVTRAELARQSGESADQDRTYVNRLIAEGLVDQDDSVLKITDAGETVTEELHEAMRQVLVQSLEGWSPENYPELLELLIRMSRESMYDDAGLARADTPPHVT
jgi:DNA-binding MarR family transcriptional regulator